MRAARFGVSAVALARVKAFIGSRICLAAEGGNHATAALLRTK